MLALKLAIKGRRLVVMVDSQSCSSSNPARMLGTGDEEEEEAKAPELVLACWGHHGANSYSEANICTPKKLLSRSLANCLRWWRRPPIISQLLPQLRFTFFPSLFSQLLHILDWRLKVHQGPDAICASYGSWPE